MNLLPARRRPGLRRLLGRAGGNLADQILSSATNAALSFLVARAVDAADFGGFAVAFTVFALLVGLSRSLATAPLGIRFAKVADAPFREAAGHAAGTALVLGVGAGLGSVIAGLLLGGPVGSALLALGLVLPGLLVQDAWRYVFFAAGRPAAALINDAVWALVQIVAVVLLLVARVSSAAPFVLAWGVAAVAAAVLGAHQARTVPRPRRTRSWLRAHHDLTRYLASEYVTLQGGQQGALLVIAAVGSLEAIGALRAVQVLLGPTTILAVAALGFAIPELSRRRSALAPRQWAGAAAGLGAVVGALGLLWGLLLALAPGAVGTALLGSTWPGARALLLPTVVGQLGAALGVGPAAALYAMDRARVTFAVHAVEAPLVLAGGVVGVVVGGATGAAWGLGLPFWVVLPMLWWRLRRELRPGAPMPSSMAP